MGTVGRLKPKGAPTSKIEIIEATKDKSFTVECGLPLCKMHFIHEMEAKAGGTEVVNHLIFSGMMAPVYGRLMGSSISKTIPKSLEGLKAHIEASG